MEKLKKWKKERDLFNKIKVKGEINNWIIKCFLEKKESDLMELKICVLSINILLVGKKRKRKRKRSERKR